MDTEHNNTRKIPKNGSNSNLQKIKKEIDAFEHRLQQKVHKLRQDLKEIEQANLITPQKAADILDITVSAVRARAERGTLTKRNGDGSKKMTNKRTEIFFDEQEVRNKI